MAININIPDGFSNDGTYKCDRCEEGMMCFTTSCDTQFCPMCGERNMSFEDWKSEEEE